MVEKKKVKLPHLLVTGTARTEPYSSPKSASSKFNIPNRNRQAHGNTLISQVENLKKKVIARKERIVNGIHVTFESEPGFKLKLESLENKRAGIELMSVKQDATGKMLATVFVPEGKLEHFIKVFEIYLNKETKKGIPKNANLVDSISNISMTVLEHLWTDKDIPFPDREEKIHWEIWLRVGENRKTIDLFKEQATVVGLVVSDEEIEFPDRIIVLAKGTATQLSQSSALINCIAEIRKTKETAEFFTSLSPVEQAEWVNETCSKLRLPDENAPSICILDTGINNGHPLLKPVLNSVDMHTYNPTWGINDHHSHGTEMAGLALYGDLTDTLSSNDPVALSHCLESVKILPTNSGQNEQHLYGYITAEAIYRAEITAPQRQRTICMAVTTTDFRDRGQPSSWSAKLDELSSGANDEQRRLIIVSAGNTELQYRHNFPNSNETDGIHDPGQAWNVLTVGAFTEKCSIDSHTYPDWRVVAEHGDLSPSSCTSIIWQKPWPIKPDIVLEGGNMAIDPDTQTADYVDSLQLLSTHWKPTNKLLVATGDTSAATALASRMAAQLQATYPNFWPETIRALLVHSAEWTNTMKKRFQIKSVAHNNKKRNLENILRCCGFGVPNLNEAMWSAHHSLTLIVQESLQPFDKIEGKYKTRNSLANRHFRRIRCNRC
jgi:hypothetical protein